MGAGPWTAASRSQPTPPVVHALLSRQSTAIGRRPHAALANRACMCMHTGGQGCGACRSIRLKRGQTGPSQSFSSDGALFMICRNMMPFDILSRMRLSSKSERSSFSGIFGGKSNRPHFALRSAGSALGRPQTFRRTDSIVPPSTAAHRLYTFAWYPRRPAQSQQHRVSDEEQHRSARSDRRSTVRETPCCVASTDVRLNAFASLHAPCPHTNV